MSDVLIEESTLQNIASAIRGKNGLITTYKVSDMATAINAFQKSGFNANDVATKNIVGSINGSASFIGSSAFYRCSALTAASFPSCISIGNYAFYSCSSLRTINFPSCTSVGIYAFMFCSSLTTASFPSCTHIGIYAFCDCKNLTTVSFPSCTSIGSYAFQYCSSLTAASFPSCTSIGDGAFYTCTKLTTISFPSCTYIGNYAFYSCSSLTTVSFSSCTSIGSYAFYRCSALTAASFPVCTSIGNSAFYNCYKLISLYLNNVSQVPTLGSSAFWLTPIDNYTFYTSGVYGSVFVPGSLYQSFLTATNWSIISARIVSIATTYSITLTGEAAEYISFTPANPIASGTTVTLTNSIDNAFYVDCYFTYTGGYGQTILGPGDSDTFTMPGENITIDCAYYN